MSTEITSIFDGDYIVTTYPSGAVVRELRFVPSALPDPTQWLIDIGPFFDRFGAAKMAVLTSTDPGVKAIVADVSVRKWVDLERADVATALAYIGSKVAVVTTALQESILTTPVASADNMALRVLYFGGRDR